MNTLKFLAFGRSLATGREVVGRFRVRHECLLPRFEEETSEQELSSGVLNNWWRRACSLFRPGARLAWAKKAAPQTVPPMAEAAAELVVKSEAFASASPLIGAASVQALPPNFTAGARRTPSALQREFRFERVSVVCNDLHDADFEIVPVSMQARAVSIDAKPHALISA